jgi:hypothetical protein
MAIPQTFSITLGSESYKVTLVWNTIANLWILDLNDSSGNPIIQGIPLVTGLGLLRQYGYLDFDGDLFVQSTTDPYALPTFAGFGSTSNLFYTTDESIL